MVGSCPRLLGEHAQKVDRTDCEIITFEVEKKVFLCLCLAGTADFDRPWCKIFELCNFELLHHRNAHHVRYLCAKS
jgi:hypothetical protein